LIQKIKSILFTKNTLGSVFWFSLLGFLGPSIKFFLLPLYLIYLTPEDYGILALVTIFSSIVAIFANLRLDAALRVFYFDYASDGPELRQYISQIFTTIVIIGIALMGSMIFLGPAIMDLAFSSDKVMFYPYGVIALATAVLTSYSTVYYIYLKNEVRLREYFIYSISYLLATIGLQFYLVVFEEMGVLGVLYGSLIPSVLIFLTICMLNRKLFTFKLKYSSIAPSLKFALPLLPFSLLFKLENQLDRLVLERYLDLETVGLYALLVGLIGMVGILLIAVENGVRPFLYRSLKEGGEEANTQINTYFNLFILVGFVTLSGILMIGSNLDLITDNYKYLSIRHFFVLASLAAIPMVVLRYLSLILIYYKKSKELTVATAVKTLIMLGLMLYMVPLFGIPGAIIAVSISYILNVIIFYILIHKFGAPKIRLDKAIKSIGIVVVSTLTCKYFITNISLMGLVQFIIIVALLIPMIIPVIRKVAHQKPMPTT
jgi:O-antigen/teichoic acid export membrane protein